MSFGVVLKLRLEFPDPPLRFLFINLSGFEFAGNFIEKSFEESFHPPSPSSRNMPGKRQRV